MQAAQSELTARVSHLSSAQGTEKEQRQALRKMLEAEVDNIQQHGITHPGFTSRYQPKHRIKKLIKSFSLSEIKNNPLQV